MFKQLKKRFLQHVSPKAKHIGTYRGGIQTDKDIKLLDIKLFDNTLYSSGSEIIPINISTITYAQEATTKPPTFTTFFGNNITIKADLAVPIKPQEAVPIKPQEAVPIKPQEAVPIKPQEAVPIKPQEAVPIKRQDDMSVSYPNSHLDNIIAELLGMTKALIG